MVTFSVLDIYPILMFDTLVTRSVFLPQSITCTPSKSLFCKHTGYFGNILSLGELTFDLGRVIALTLKQSKNKSTSTNKQADWGGRHFIIEMEHDGSP